MTFNPVQNKIFLATLFILLSWFLYVISDYLFPIFWALVLAIMFIPVSEFIEKKLKLSKKLSAVAVIFSFIIFLCIPIIFIGNSALKEGVFLQKKYFSEESDSVLMSNLGLLVGQFENKFGLPEGDIMSKAVDGIKNSKEFFGSRVIDFGQNTLGVIFALFLALYITYFFMVNHKQIRERLIRLLPLGDTRERELIGRFAAMTRATIKGTLIIIIAQAAVAFVLFYILGVDGSALWALLLGIASLIPLIGSALVWVPVALGFILAGSVTKGIVVILFGVIVLSNLDNILRPLLVGKETGVPDVIILISTLGGLATFGLTGLILGPVLASLVLVMLDMYEREYSTLLDTDN